MRQRLFVSLVSFASTAVLLGCPSSVEPKDTPDVSTILDAGETVDAGEIVDGGAADVASGSNCHTFGPDDQPWTLSLPWSGNNGAFDPSLEADPETGRLWLSYSAVDGPIGEAKVSTHLAYSDDGGLTWCEGGRINSSVDVAPLARPSELALWPSHWNHEVPSLVRDPGAPTNERWKMFWHRYLEALDNDPATENRRFQHGWIAMRAAARPEDLADAAERKLFSALGYNASLSVTAYNDAIIGPPEVALAQDPGLGHCLVFSEPGAMAWHDELYLSLSCGAIDGLSTVLIRLDRGGPAASWVFVGTLMQTSQAQAVLDAALGPGAPTLQGVSASDLFSLGGVPTLAISPLLDGLYLGCWFFDVALTTASLGSVEPLRPRSVQPHSEAALQSGMCTYDDAAQGSGMLFGETHVNGLQFRLLATGRSP